jgi:hypothetical protein
MHRFGNCLIAGWREDYMYTIVAGAGAVVIIGVAVFLVMRRKPS